MNKKIIEKLITDETDNPKDIAKICQSKFCEDFLLGYLNPKSKKVKSIKEKLNNPFYVVNKNKASFVIISGLSRSYDSSISSSVAIISELYAERFGKFRLIKINYKEKNEFGVKGRLSRKVSRYISEIKKEKKLVVDEEKFEKLAHDFSEGFDENTELSDMILAKDEIKEIYVMEGKLGGNLDAKNMRANAEKLLIQKALLIDQNPGYKVKHYLSTQYNFKNQDSDRLSMASTEYFGHTNCLIGKAFWEFVTNNKCEDVWSQFKAGLEEGTPENWIETLVEQIKSKTINAKA